MSSPHQMDLARRVCDASKSICDLLASRVLLKAMRNDDLIRSPDVSDPAIFTRFSMGVTEQMAHFARLDAISAQIDEWEGLPAATNTSKSNSRSKKNLLEDTNQSVDAEDEVVIHTNVVLNAFNEQRFSSAIDVAKLCDQDKQTFRPIFRHVPKLQEVVKQIEALVEADKTPKPLDSNGAQLTDLLRRLNQLVLDVTYLEQHRHIFDRPDIEPYDDPIQADLEELYKQIMNLY